MSVQSGKLPLIVGEIYVDVTILPAGVENKLRLGGVVHAARAFWANSVPYAVAAFLPDYLNETAPAYLEQFGCVKFIKLGTVVGAPNITLVFDPREIDDQGYETLLRDEKEIVMSDEVLAADLTRFSPILVFPGAYDLSAIAGLVPADAQMVVDIAYDISSLQQLEAATGKIDTLTISTSSTLFKNTFEDFQSFAEAFSPLSPKMLILKENRGGSRAYSFTSKQTINVPAYLGETLNSVGVGDVFDAMYSNYFMIDRVEALWRGSFAASAYAQTTEPDLFREYVRRDIALSKDEVRTLDGVVLPWEERPRFNIYLAAPDFSHADRSAIQRVLSALKYHNFSVRRPIQENGELASDSNWSTLNATYHRDVSLLESCDLVFAVPTGKDPGTLVEIGLAIANGVPVIVYDPNAECRNTMVMAGASTYSSSLGHCLTAVFELLSERRMSRL